MRRYKMICPLINFEISDVLLVRPGLSNEETFRLLNERKEALARGIDLIGTIRIRRASAEDLKDLEPTILIVPSDAMLSSNMFVIEKYFDAEQSPSPGIDQLIRNAVLALRLLKKGYVSYNFTYYILVSEERRLESWLFEEKRRSSLYLEYKYVLKLEEHPALEELFRKLQGIDSAAQKSLDLACTRFQRAYEEEDVDGRLIDLVIALEALFLKGVKAKSSQGEMIAIACSNLLGKNSDEREKIRELLTKAYSIRNKIVHGSESFIGKETEIAELNHAIDGYLRESIKRFLD